MQLPDSLHPKFKSAIEQFIGNIGRILKEEFHVYLFGSLARGDYLLDSDVDIIVVTDALKEMKKWERTAFLRKYAPTNIGFDTICYTNEEFNQIRDLLEGLVKIA